MQTKKRSLGNDPDEVLRDVTAVVEEVRKTRYDKRAQEAAGDR